MSEDPKIHALKTNRHPADQLADVRAQIRKLETVERKLRRELIASPHRDGDEWIAKVVDRKFVKYNFEAMVKHYGTAAMEPFKISKTTVYVLLRSKGAK